MGIDPLDFTGFDTFKCPHCKTKVKKLQPMCHGCGTTINWIKKEDRNVN